LERYPEKIHWDNLSLNESPNAIRLLERYPEKINWHYLSSNPAAIRLLEENPDKIHWWWLSKNPAAVHLLKQNPDKIDCGMLSQNPNIMEIICGLDYDVMKGTMQPFAEELTSYVFHPVRMNRIAEQYNIPFDELITDIY
jgi:hypothetical protein